MPWFSYHSGHSGEFCRHAKDNLEQVVQRAIEVGFTHYGLSEHSPRSRAEDLFPEEQDLGVDGIARQFERYVTEARALQERYADRIELIVGFETEKLPEGGWEEAMRTLRKRHGFEYCVGSVHSLQGHWIDYSPEATRDLADACGGVEAMQRMYFESVAELVDALRPEVVGHIDLVRKFDGMEAAFSSRVLEDVERTLEVIRECGSRLDVNAGAMRRELSPVYPLPSILARARQMGIGVTLGDDGHGVATVGVGLDECMNVIAAAGYRDVEYLTRDGASARWASAPIGEVRPPRPN